MAKNVDTVITGLRTAAAGTVSADELRRPQPRIAYADEPRAAFPTRFQSICQHLILTLNIRTPQNDGTMKDNKFNVVFSGGFVDITQRAYPFPAERVSKELQARSGYGIGKTFWDADEFMAVSEKQALDAKLDILKSLAQTEDGRAALKAALGDTFQLPAPPSAE